MGSFFVWGSESMKIAKVLNNSCVIILDDNEKEMILLGNGVGYARKPGDPVDKSKIDKVFVLEDDKKVTRFGELLKSVPISIVNLSESLIEYANDLLKVKLDEGLHISLPDHIHNAVLNFKQGIVLHNTLLLEIQKFYQKEFMIGERALSMVKESEGVQMPVDEAGFIAMHFVNAQSQNENNQARAIISMVEEMDRIISRTFGDRMASIDKTSLGYCRYMTHLKFFAQRVISKTSFTENDTRELGSIVRKYREEFECSRRVCEYIAQKYDYHVHEEEEIYLTVHLVQIMGKRS